MGVSTTTSRRSGTTVFQAANPTVDADLALVNPQAHTYGVRVPAFLVSPLIARGVPSHNIYDHTSITRTILQRFAPDKVAYMPERVRRSRHFGELLLTTPRTSIRNPPTVRQAGCRTSQLAFSTPASDVFYDRIVAEPDDERTTLQRLGTHGLI
jgi:phospholipase C